MSVNYPNPSLNQKKMKVTRSKTYGLLFENALNISNEYYKVHGKALIYKKPTPIQVVKVDYPMRSKAKIVEGYYKTPSTTDYNGIYRGKYIDYEAKETNNLSFDFKHIFPHQIEHLVNVDKHGGIAFVIIFFKKLDEIYLIDIKNFNNLYENGMKNGAKSIKIETMKEIGTLIKLGYTPPIDYLKAIDELYF
jgi:recombination protein U